MAYITIYRSLVPFTMPLANNEVALVSEDLLQWRFNFHIGTIYVEQKLYDESGVVFKIFLMQKTRHDIGSLGPLSLGCFRIN